MPKVVVTPGNVSEMQGGNIRALCKATGSPFPDIQWNLDLLSSHHEVRQSAVRISQLICVSGSSSPHTLEVVFTLYSTALLCPGIEQVTKMDGCIRTQNLLFLNQNWNYGDFICHEGN